MIHQHRIEKMLQEYPLTSAYLAFVMLVALALELVR